MSRMWREMVNLFSEENDKSFIVPEKPESALRWIILVLACIMLVGSYYCVDIPAAIKTQIDDYFGDPSYYETYFSLLYTLYAAPNVILPFFGGYFVDKFGVRLCLLIFTSLIGIGQIIFALGISIKSWPVIFLGRLIFGFGGESLIVANSALLADWFRGKELAFAFGINLSIARVGSVVNNVLSPLLTEKAGLVFAMWFGVIICAISVFSVVLTIPIDKAMDERLDAKEPLIGNGSFTLEDENRKSLEQIDSTPLYNSFDHDKSLSTPNKADIASSSDQANDGEPKFRDVFLFSHIFWLLVILCIVVYSCVLPFNNVASSLLLERNYFIEPDAGCALQQPGCQSSTNQPNMMCTTAKWYQPPLPYDVTMPDGTYYAQVTSSDIDCTSSMWKDVCTVDYCNRLADGEAQAAVIMSIPYIISGCLSPFLGIAIDRYGYRAFISTLAPLFLILVHSLLAYSSVDPVGPLVGQGLAYTGFAAVLWPAIPLVVEERLTGLAFGVVTSMMNLGCAVLPLFVAMIFNDYGSYIPYVENLFIILAVIGSIVGIYLNIYDYTHGSVLNMPDGAASSSAPKDYKEISVTVDYHNEEGNTNDSSLKSVTYSDYLEGVSSPMATPQMTNTQDEVVGSYVSDESGWKMDIGSMERRAFSSVAPSSENPFRDNVRQHSVSTRRTPMLDGHHHGHHHHRTRGSSFTAYEQIHRGGGF